MVSTIKFVSILLILIAVGFIAYFGYKNFSISESSEEEIIYKSLFVRILDNATGQQIEREFNIYLSENNELYKTEKSFDNGRNKVDIPFNKSFFVISSSSNDTGYYWTKTEDIILLDDRDFTLQMNPHGDFTVKHEGTFAKDELINITLFKNGTVSKITPCIRWSLHILYADVLDLERIEFPKRLDGKVDKCYKAKEFEGNNLTFHINYKFMDSIDENDFIKLYFIDYDLNTNKSSFSENLYVFEDSFGDIGINDKIYIINKSIK